MGDELIVNRRILSPPSVVVSPLVRSFASSTWLSCSCMDSERRPPRYPNRVRPVASRKASLTFAAGEYAKDNLSCTDCRNRENGPKPGKKAKNVGDADTPVCTRFDWLTHAPLVSVVFTR